MTPSPHAKFCSNKVNSRLLLYSISKKLPLSLRSSKYNIIDTLHNCRINEIYNYSIRLKPNPARLPQNNIYSLLTVCFPVNIILRFSNIL